MLRRMLAITLLIAFGSPLVLPLFAATADPQAGLPACCRMHGAHHCTMLMPGANTSPAFHAPPCRLFPTTSTPLRLATASLVVRLLASIKLRRDPAPITASPRPARTFSPSSNLQRGPPALLA